MEKGDFAKMLPGDYCIDTTGVWWVYPPKDGCGPVRLDGWSITEHGDGSITVSPSIFVNPPQVVRVNKDAPSWHGYLEQGIWREC